jgi:3D (Asp-Asp-Asp) domain-containing protein
MPSARVIVSALCLILLPASAGAKPRAKAHQPMRMYATAYCTHGHTASGDSAQEGVVAVDPRVIPIGSNVRIKTLTGPYSGLYIARDTGSAVKGRRIDIFMKNCTRAKQFGRRPVLVSLVALRGERSNPRPLRRALR